MNTKEALKTSIDSDPVSEEGDEWGLTPVEWKKINPVLGSPEVTTDPVTKITRIIFSGGVSYITRQKPDSWQIQTVNVEGVSFILPVPLLERFNPRLTGTQK